MNFNVDKENNKIQVIREFAAPVSRVWKAWTQQELLDQWWAPKPWTAQTKEMDFREGGKWIYAMVSPEGEKHWARTDFQSVKTLVSFTGLDAFVDEKGNKNTGLPESSWKVEFDESSITTTLVSVEIEYDSSEDLEKILEMGFIEGFSAALQNLDELLAEQENL
ncbi:MAG TPA: SRPBCC domain-containing protein [Salinimicrobium catena]|uniref:SRPBCC domain-containing protein n=1 Tax=Salinimicrobium catena TaxID=390640 RepID=A0A7C2R8A5_9FLAO|nr:SRPBCC domain-containing protein [Salinimicrobium catena]